MRVGVVTPYYHCPRTYAAIQLSRMIATRAIVTVRTTTSRRIPVDPYLDGRVTRGDFVSWLADTSPGMVVWFTEPEVSDVAAANKAGALTVGVIDLDSISAKLFDAYKLMARVMAPSYLAVTTISRSWRLNNVVACPWAIDAMPRSRVPLPTNPTIVIHLDRVDDAGLAALSRLLVATPCHLTIYRPPRFAARLRRLRHRWRGRVSLVGTGTYDDYCHDLASHDIAILPRRDCSFGLAVMHAANSGAVVAAFGGPPVDEFIFKPELSRDTALPDLIDFVISRMQRPWHISVTPPELHQTISTRRKIFIAAWDAVFASITRCA